MEKKDLEQEGLKSNSSAESEFVQGEIPVSDAAMQDAGLARELEELQQKYSELNDRYLRLAADFDNYKKRVARDQEMLINAAIEAFAADILEVADNLERASAAEDEKLREGLEQIRKLLMAIFERHEIAPIESLNERFDPEVHEAIAYVPSDHEEGIIIDELIRGYRKKDKVIRCAKVAVSRGND